MKKTKEAVIERLTEIFDSIRYGMEATIVIHCSSSEIPIINYDIEEAVVKRGENGRHEDSTNNNCHHCEFASPNGVHCTAKTFVATTHFEDRFPQGCMTKEVE